MWKVAVIFNILAIASLASGQEITPFVRGGRDATVGEFPGDVRIETPVQFGCQGVLLNNRHVLTAASCVVNATDRTLFHPMFLTVFAGDRNLFQPSVTRVIRTVSHIYPHDQYNPMSFVNNLAVLRLNADIPLPHVTIQEAVLNTRIVPDQTECVFTGWGVSANETVTMTPTKRLITVNIVNNEQCNGPTFAHPGRVMDNMICATNNVIGGTPPLETNAVCQGNTGGGLYCNGYLTGILSMGLGCGAQNHPGIYMQVRMMRQWINQQSGRTDTIAAGTVFPRA